MPKVSQGKPLGGFLVALAGTALWSASAIFISYLTTRFQMPPLTLAFWRDFLVTGMLAGTLAVVAPRHLPLDRGHLPFFGLYGLVLAILNSLWTISVALNGAAVAAVLLYISPSFTAVIGWRWFGESFTKAKVAALALSLVGCVLASGAYSPSAWHVNLTGIAAGLGTGLVFTAYSLMGKRASIRGINPWTTTLYAFAFGSAFLLFLQRPETMFWLSRPWAAAPGGWREATLGWGALLFLAIGPTLGGYGLYTVSLTYLAASTANLILTLEPAMTAALAFLFLGERLSAAQLLGGGLILVGVLALRLSEQRDKRLSAHG